ncbi:penicillin-binding protein 2 [Vibrio lentus]|uniref:penicillin-binding protein 2 n=1 Tax=Vibrio lentus TaxID=136468 RepID=UPI000C8512D7|nr:penicillin-binding protein 2 [Vibrio lentus]PMG25748.1 penicillin-binding protein 2 [Vibrio lentus]PMH15727.1 penicillin-binding protein 2 [Vibrio lentus]PMJ07132.1 penicillin-binding protein 2 [Vibrio lentus]PMK87826.1 penicillin-binding protein 2 [Vibrio lentus]PMN14845.1 penicillin-binding protein 2 [Vibrio lentus]
MNHKRVKMRDHKGEVRLFRNRVIIAFIGILLFTLVLVGNLYRLQVQNFENYQTRANGNRIKVLPIPPVRGLIFDRNGKPLAENKLVYNLTMVPEKSGDIEPLLEQLNQYIPLSQEKIDKFKERYKHTRRFKTVTIIENLTEEEIARFSVHQYQFPGVAVDTNLTRFYPNGEVLTHVLGYVAHINDGDLRKLEELGKRDNYQATTIIGKLGVERYYEDLLHGQKGYQEVEVNSRGRVVRTIKYVPPVAGKDIVLNIDLDLQKYVFEQLKGRTGSAVVLDPGDNSVLAMASSPSYDPNLFVDGISSKNYQRLLHDPAHPLVNRSTLGVYPPGSTIKPFMAVAGLEEHIISKNTVRNDHGSWRIPGSKPNSKSWRDWKRWGHGPVDVTQAIEESVDSFFYQIAFDLGIDRISKWMNRFGFGEPTGIDIYEESNANMPTREWKMMRYRTPWYQGDTVPIGIGQGYWTSTPLQLAKATSVLVNHGKVIAPHLLRATLDHGEDLETQTLIQPEKMKSIDEVPDSLWEVPINAMRLVNHGSRGSGRKAFKGSEYTSGGKSGTSQVFGLAKDQVYNSKELERHLLDHALYTAFAPYDNPEYVATVVIEHGNGGSKVGAPYIRKVLDYAFEHKSGQNKDNS